MYIPYCSVVILLLLEVYTVFHCYLHICFQYFRGFRSTGGQNFHFPFDFAGHRYNSAAATVQHLDPQAEFFYVYGWLIKIYGCFSAKPYFFGCFMVRLKNSASRLKFG